MSAETIKAADIKSFPITILVGANPLTLNAQAPASLITTSTCSRNTVRS